MNVTKYKRGQIWWYGNNDACDGNTYNSGKIRPIIIVSNDLANRNSNNLIAIPCTTQPKKDMPTHVNFRIDGTDNTALCENMMSINIAKMKDYIGTCDDELLKCLEQCIAIAIGLVEIPIKIPVVNVAEQPIIYEESTPYEPYTQIADNSADNFEDKKPGRKPKYDLADKIRFVQDYQNHTVDYMMTKYGEVSAKAVTNKVYRFRKELEKENI